MSLNCLPRAADDHATAVDRSSWEGTPAPRLRSWLILGALFVLAAVGLGITVREFAGIQLFFMEDGPVEMVQAGVLMLVAIAFAFAFLRSSGARALFCLVAAYATTFAVTRELPRCGSAFSGEGICLDSGWKTTIVLAVSALALLALFWRRPDWRRVLALSNLRWVWPCFVVVVMLAGAEAAEHRVRVEIEESLELAGYLYLAVFAGWVLLHTLRRPAAQRPTAPGQGL